MRGVASAPCSVDNGARAGGESACLRAMQRSPCSVDNGARAGGAGGVEVPPAERGGMPPLGRRRADAAERGGDIARV